MRCLDSCLCDGGSGGEERKSGRCVLGSEKVECCDRKGCLVSGAEDLGDEGGELIGEVGFEHLNDIGEAAGFEVFDGRSDLSDDEEKELIEAGLDDGIEEG